MKAKIGDDYWVVKRRVQEDSAWTAWCDFDSHTMYLHPTLEGRNLMEVAIHEIMHALYPCLSEDAIRQGAISVTRLLWLLGFRPNGEHDSLDHTFSSSDCVA